MTSNERIGQRAVISRLRLFVPIAIRPLCLFVAVAAVALVQFAPPASAVPPFTVTKAADTNDGVCDSDCSLREAVIAANAGPLADGIIVPDPMTLAVPAGTYNLTIAGTGEDASAKGDLDLTADVNIAGAGAATVIDATGLGDRVLHVLSGVTAQVSHVTISGGGDGGIYNAGVFTLNSSTVTGNSASSGGGIGNNGSLGIYNSTISGNSAILGGGITSSGPLFIHNSTISGNSASTGIGGIYNGGALTVNSSTISGNTAPSAGGGIANEAPGTATLKNTILANGSGNCFGGGITSAGYNLSSDASCAFGGAGDVNSTAPMLDPLANNGGFTETHALLTGSPAIDTGSCTDSFGNAVTADQRGVPRPQGATCDKGAFEVGVPGHDLFETTSSSVSFSAPLGYFGTIFGIPSDPYTGTVSLRGQAIDSVNLGTTDTIVKRRHAPDLSGMLPSTDTVPIEIVALSLVSTAPITVTYTGLPVQWDVEVGLTPAVTQLVGTMTITKQNASGGTFDATLPVQARLTFTSQFDSTVRTADASANFDESGGPWRYMCPPIVLVVAESSPDYCAGTDGTNRVSTTWNIPFFGQSTMLPACADPDGDVVCTTLDNCPTTVNANQANADGDSFGNACDPCANDMANDADLDGVCVGAGFMAPKVAGNDNCPTVANTGQQNADGDPWGDACDGCPSTVTAWATPPGDVDCDAFPSSAYDAGTNRAAESFMGTDTLDACADSTTPNDERGPVYFEPLSPWPMDNNDDRKAALGDILGYIPVFGTTGPGLPYKARYDLNADNKIGLSDILMFIPFFNITCTP